jgi:hypothetical protein
VEDQKHIVEVLGELLSPLGDSRKNTILKWVKREIQTAAIVTYVEEAGAPIVKESDGTETGGPLLWKVGEPSPINETETVFAMFVDDEGEVTAFSFSEESVEDKVARYFFRTIIFKPIHVHGPVHANALVREIGNFIGDEPEEPDEPDVQHTNGEASP